MSFKLLCTVAPLAFGAVAKPLNSRADATDTMLYAYGANGIGGFPIVNVGGMQLPSCPIELKRMLTRFVRPRVHQRECTGYAKLDVSERNMYVYLGSPSSLSVLRMAPDYSHSLSVTSSNGTMVAHTNNETLLLAIPEHGDIRFVDNSNASLTTTGLGWYGKMLYLRVDGKMETLWTAQPTSEQSVYKLGWNISGTPALDLRMVAPSHP